MKIPPVENGRTEITKLMIAFRNFANAPSNYLEIMFL